MDLQPSYPMVEKFVRQSFLLMLLKFLTSRGKLVSKLKSQPLDGRGGEPYKTCSWFSIAADHDMEAEAASIQISLCCAVPSFNHDYDPLIFILSRP